MDRRIELAWWQKKLPRRFLVVGILSVLAVVTTNLLLGPAERSLRLPEANVTIATVARGAFHDFIPLRARIVPLQTVYLDALEGGRVEKILAQAGDQVIEGQVLVELSNTELELDVLDREGRLIESMTQLQAYETQLEQNRISNLKALAQIDYDITRLQRSLARYKQLAVRSLTPRDTKEALEDELSHAISLRPMQAESNRKQEELRVRQAPQIESQIEKLQHDLKITHSKLDNLIVRAPVAGRLTSMDLKVGENRNRGERFAEITAEAGYKLSADVDEYYLQRVTTGQTALIELGTKTFQAKVTRVYAQVKNGTFAIDLSFAEEKPAALLPGQTVQGRLSLGADTFTTILPAGPFLERTGGDWVFVLEQNGRFAQRRSVQLGRRNSEQVEVLGDLAVGERVIVSDYSGLERAERIELAR